MSVVAELTDWAEHCGVQTLPMPETPPGERTGAMTTPPYLRRADNQASADR